MQYAIGEKEATREMKKYNTIEQGDNSKAERAVLAFQLAYNKYAFRVFNRRGFREIYGG